MRILIPEAVAAEVLFRHDRTCCVCQMPGKSVQIHHIDDDPSNNDDRNLAALCFDCHDDTQIKGGFGRKLNAAQVIKFRDDWVTRIATLRQRVDELMLQKQLGIIDAAASPPVGEWHPPGELELAVYLQSIPDTMKKAYELARPEWDKGATNTVAQATYQVIRVAERLWIGLSAWYPPKHFGNKDATEYFSEYVAKRYELRYALIEPEGPRTGGSMIRPMVAYGVLLDVQATIALTVGTMAAFGPACALDIEKWDERFAEAINSYPC